VRGGGLIAAAIALGVLLLPPYPNQIAGAIGARALFGDDVRCTQTDTSFHDCNGWSLIDLDLLLWVSFWIIAPAVVFALLRAVAAPSGPRRNSN
jgi:hypothetical protein